MTTAEHVPGEELPRTQDDRFRRWEIPLAAWFPVLVLAAFLLVPVLGVFIGLFGWPFAPVPLVRLAHRRGAGAVAGAVALCAAVLAVLFVPAEGWSAGIAVGLVGAMLVGLPALFAARARRDEDPSRAFLGLCAAGLVLFNGLLLALPLLLGGPPVGVSLKAVLDAHIPAALESYRRANMDAVTLEQMRATLVQAGDLTVRYWPGLLGVYWVLASSVAYYAGAWAARPALSAENVRFERLQVPAGAAGLFVATGAGFALLQGTARSIAGDVLLALAALYFVAGLSIICHFARRWFRARILRLGLYVLVAYFPMSLGVALVGLFDWYVHFRQRGEKE